MEARVRLCAENVRNIDGERRRPVLTLARPAAPEASRRSATSLRKTAESELPVGEELLSAAPLPGFAAALGGLGDAAELPAGALRGGFAGESFVDEFVGALLDMLFDGDGKIFVAATAAEEPEHGCLLNRGRGRGRG
jgi:hypothetical protein